jgi:Zn-finger nucleic acid-binding protein
MRLLVACQKCRRQYDATGRKVGSRFHCHCGNVVTVRQPTGRDCAVVRCSSCGAPRQSGSAECGFCHSDFTLHERDLDTVCPACLARVSGAGRYCHHCGVGLAAEFQAGAESELKCPTCPPGRALTSRRIGQEGVTVLECGRCAGLWLGEAAFNQLTSRAIRQRDPDGRKGAAKREQRLPKRPAGPLYRSCIVCGKLMTRRHYGRTSGVIVDFCKDHGVWFDADELAQILSWIRSGGPGQDADVVAGLQRRPDRTPSPGSRPVAWSGGDLARDEGGFVGVLVDLLLGQWRL